MCGATFVNNYKFPNLGMPASVVHILNKKQHNEYIKYVDMERKISFDDVQKAVVDAYEEVKSLKEGEIDPRVADISKAGTFGVSLVLTDGRSVHKGDMDTVFPLGPIVKVPVSVVLLSQNTPQELVKKACDCGASCGCHKGKEHKAKMLLPFGKHGLRAVSAIQPQGDPESKFSLVTNMITAMSGAPATLNDSMYKYYQQQTAADKVVDQLSVEGAYRIYDDPAQTVDEYSRLLSLQMSTRQLATMGATIAADGRNPYSGQYAFDGTIAAPVVALMATRGKHFIKPWMVLTGLPAKKTFAGGILAVLPGFGALAAYAPEVCGKGVSVKASRFMELVAQKLGLSVYSSARVEVEK